MAVPPSSPISGLPSANPSASYWLTDPSPILEGHRTTEKLPTEADVVIVGSGITGAFAGWFLKMGIDTCTNLEYEEGRGDDSDSEDDKHRFSGEDVDCGKNHSGDGCCGLKDVVCGLFRGKTRGQAAAGRLGDDYEEQSKVDEKSASPKSRKHHGSVVMLEAREVCSGATGRVSLACQVSLGPQPTQG